MTGPLDDATTKKTRNKDYLRGYKEGYARGYTDGQENETPQVECKIPEDGSKKPPRKRSN